MYVIFPNTMLILEITYCKVVLGKGGDDNESRVSKSYAVTPHKHGYAINGANRKTNSLL